MKQHLSRHKYWILAGCLALTVLASASIGSVPIAFSQVGRMLLFRLPYVDSLLTQDWSRAHELILWNIRLPRILLGLFVGGGLGVAGAIFQGLLGNPLADPYIIGVSSGASLGASIAILFIIPLGLPSLLVLPPFAFIGALLAAWVVYQLGSVRGKVHPPQLLLAGVAVAAFLTALVSFLIVLRIQNLQEVYLWLMGSLAGRNWTHVHIALLYTGIGLLASIYIARDLNLLLLGEETAHSMGIDVQRLQRRCLLIGALMAAAAVAVSGVIGFVGLMVPHAVRLVIGPDHRVLIPTSFFVGAIFLIAADTLARTLLSPIELPVGIITAFFGGPFFLYLLTKNMRGDTMW